MAKNLKGKKSVDEDLADSQRALKRLKEAGYGDGNGAYSLGKHIDKLQRIKRRQNGAK